MSVGEGNGTPLQYSCLENPMDRGAWWAAVHGVAQSWTRLSDFTFTFHFPALEKEMATRSSVLVWRIPGTVEPGGLPSMGSHRVGHNWSNLVALVRKIYSHGGRYYLATETYISQHILSCWIFTWKNMDLVWKQVWYWTLICNTSLGISGKAMEKFMRQKKKNQLNLITNDNHSRNNMKELC